MKSQTLPIHDTYYIFCLIIILSSHNVTNEINLLINKILKIQ